MNLLEALEGLVSGKLKIMESVINLMRLEARLAGQSILPLLLNLCLLGAVLLSLWASVSVLVGYGLFLFTHNILIALTGVCALNALLLLSLLKYLRFNLNNMSFEKTRNYFSPKQGASNENFQKSTHLRHRKNGKPLTLPTRKGKKA
jgi:hypothetical protein